MKKWIEVNISPGVLDGLNRREFYRICKQNRLIDDVDLWMNYHITRNNTSHIYNQIISIEVFEKAKNFVFDAKKLLKILESL